MRTITRLTATGRRAARTTIELDGEDWAAVDTEVVLARELSRGDVLDEGTREAILADDAFVRARRAAACLLQTRPRSVAELRRRLEERKFDERTIDRAVAHFEEKGDLDDARFARVFARHQFKTRLVGPLKVRAQLRQLGVDEGLIDRALAQDPAAAPAEQERRARQLIRRRLNRLAGDDDPVRRRGRLRALLLRSWFDPETFRPLLDEAADRGD